MVLCTARTLGGFCRFQFGNDLVDCRRCTLDRLRDGATAERTESFAGSREIHFRNRDVLTLDVPPDVHLGPITSWLDPNVLAFRSNRRSELSPEFRRLIFVIPFEL